ncbi:MAG: serpin family protein [Planctomycetia bacterium]|nr:serpin family protein [Planctomycetia bacterium]
MLVKRALVATLLFVVAGCAAGGPTPDGRSKKTDARMTHVVTADTPYYRTGPQQGRPPDGELKAQSRVRLVRAAGSYSLVELRDGSQVYVDAAALEPIGELRVVVTPDVRSVAQSSNQFAIDLYKRLIEAKNDNVFCSPASISTALAMTYAGAGGQTAEQMAAVLHLDLPTDRLYVAFAELTKMFAASDSASGVQLNVANRLWGQEGYKFLPEFLDRTRDTFAAGLAQVDFEGQSEAARAKINDWVGRETEGKIENLMPPGSIDTMTRLVLTNAIYFKGRWTEPFKAPMTEPAPFHALGGKDVEVPLMRQKEHFGYFAADGLQLLELPYGKGEMSMIVLLPEKNDGIAELESRLSAATLDEWTAGLGHREVRVLLPKFKLEAEYSLKDVLAALGMPLAFEPDRADFSGMTSEEKLFLSAVIHKAVVDVNEEGTEAAAATGIAVGATAAPADQPPTFRADHPFVFLIREKTTGSVLFLGRFVGPEK